MKKKMDDNRKISQKLFASWLIAGLLLVLSIMFSKHLVFEGLIIITIAIIFIISSQMLINTIIKHYRRTYWILTILTPVLMIVFSCLVLTTLLIAPPSKSCQLETINMAFCSDTHERFGTGIPQPPPCYWKQMHIVGLILIGDEIEKECRSNG